MSVTRSHPPALRLLAIFGAAVLSAAFVLLGNWQWTRAEQKEALRLRIEMLERQPAIALGGAPADPGFMDLRPVTARGVWLADRTVLIDNRIHRGRPGFHVVTPLRLEGSSMHVLVNRGWLAAPRLRSELPQVATPTGSVDIAGVAQALRGRFIELSAANREGRIWQNLTIERFREFAQIDLQPVVIRQTGAADDGLLRDWEPPDVNAAKHRFIAFQWYAFATAVPVALFVLWLRGRRARRNK